MKKILSLILIFILGVSCLTLAGCKKGTLENTFFSDEVLKEYKLEGLPKANLVNSRIDSDYDTLYLNLTLDEYASYSRDVYEFIRNKSDLYYQGYVYGNYLIAELVPAYEVTDIYSKYDYKNESNGFSYSIENVLLDENEVNTDIKLKNSKQVFIESSSGELRGGFKYNTIMYFESKASSFKKCGLEHTYKESYDLPIAGTNETRTVYNCIYCDSHKIELQPGDYADEKVYNINVITGSDLLKYGLIERTYSRVIVNVKTKLIMDESIMVKANGTVIPLNTYNSEYNTFSFIMPHGDVNIEIYIEGGM